MGPSLALCTLRVRLGGRHSGSATSCFCADPCTQSVQDLNRLLCFHNFGNRGIWCFLHRHGCLGLDDALLWLAASGCVQTTSLLEQQEVLLLLPVFSQGGGGGDRPCCLRRASVPCPAVSGLGVPIVAREQGTQQRLSLRVSVLSCHVTLLRFLRLFCAAEGKRQECVQQ